MLYAVAANAQPVPGVSTKTLTPKEVRATLNKLGLGKLANAWGLTGYKSLYQQRCVVGLQLYVYSTPKESTSGIYRSQVKNISAYLDNDQPKGCPKLPAPKIKQYVFAAYSDQNRIRNEAPAAPKDMFEIDEGATDNDLRRAKEAIRLVQVCVKSSKPCSISISYEDGVGWIQKHMNLVRLDNIQAIDSSLQIPGFKPGIQIFFDAGQGNAIQLLVQSRSGPIYAVNFFLVIAD